MTPRSRRALPASCAPLCAPTGGFFSVKAFLAMASYHQWSRKSRKTSLSLSATLPFLAQSMGWGTFFAPSCIFCAFIPIFLLLFCQVGRFHFLQIGKCYGFYPLQFGAISSILRGVRRRKPLNVSFFLNLLHLEQGRFARGGFVPPTAATYSVEVFSHARTDSHRPTVAPAGHR